MSVLSDSDSSRSVPIAVVGLGCLLPGAAGPQEFWDGVLGARDLIRDVPPDRWLLADYHSADESAEDRTYARRGAFISDVDFDPVAYGIPPRSLSAIDTTQLLALLVAEQTLADCRAGELPEQSRERTSVILGSGSLELMNHMAARMQRPVWAKVLRERGLPEPSVHEICDAIAAHYVPWQEDTFPGLLSNVVAGRVANRFDLHGANHTVDAACASSLAAVHAAVAELSLRRADLVLTGGVDTMNDITMFMCFTKTTALSRSGDCRPFAEEADGTVLGEGLAMLALKRLADAERDGDRVYAVIRGTGAASDGRGAAIYAPQAAGQERALRRAYQDAGYGPDTVELVEAHGTGTRAGDATEFAALRTVFDGAGRADRQWCALGSVKSQLGHTKYAAGAVGLLKTVLALHTKALPPTIKADRPNPELKLSQSPFYLSTRPRPWIRDARHPRRASVSGFGFGGSDFHVTLEEYAPAARPAEADARLRGPDRAQLILLSGDGIDDAVASIRRLPRGVPLDETARQAARTFRAEHPVRAAVRADDPADLARKLDAVVGALRATAAGGQVGELPTGCRLSVEPADPGRVAFLFPGQGSQYVEMGAGLALRWPQARRVWDRMAGLELADGSLHRMVFPPPALDEGEQRAQQRALAATEWAQPALAVQSLALLSVLDTLGLRPHCVAGHSFGELVALHAAGVLDAADLVTLARRRGEFMRAAGEGTAGGMLAVTADRETVARALAATGVEDAWIANDNSPRQVVLAGTSPAIERLAAAFTDAGLPTTKLNVSAAFHSPLVASAAQRLTEAMADLPLRTPEIDVYGNADAARYPSTVAEVPEAVGTHLRSQVRFRDMVEAMYADGVRTFVEVGADDKLSRLVHDVLSTRTHVAVALDRRGRPGVSAFHDGLAQLAVAGVAFDAGALFDAPDPRPERTSQTIGIAGVKINGKNHANPYPAERTADYVTDHVPDHVADHVYAQAPAEAPRGPAANADADADAWDAPIDAQRPPSSQLLRTFEEFQRQTAEAHTSFQRLLADSHREFLRTTEASFAAVLGIGAAEQPLGAADPSVWSDVPRREDPAGALTSPDRWETSVLEPPPQHTYIPAPLPAQLDGTWSAPGVAEEPATLVASAANEQPQPQAQADVAGLVVSVVAERTGYPAEVLSMDMELESHLGIDSIKRVEILSALRRQTGQTIGSNTADLAALRTLADVVDALGEAMSGGSADRAGADRVGVTAADASREPVRSAASRDAPGPQSELADGGGVVGERVSAAEESGPCDVRRYAIRAVSSPSAEMAGPGIGPGLLAVVGDRGGLAERVTQELATRGVRARVADDVPDDADHVLFLGGLGECASADQALSILRAALGAARCFDARARAGGAVFVTVQDTGGDFGRTGPDPARAWLGGLAGLARTAAKEWPKATVKAIDCARRGRTDGEVAEAIVHELLHGGPELEVGLGTDVGRITLRPVPAPIESGAEPSGSVGPDSVIVVSGGARGVTAAAALALARAHQPKLALLGRTRLDDEPPGLADAVTAAQVAARLAAQRPEAERTALLAQAKQIIAAREIRATLASLVEAGSEAHYVCADVADAEAVKAALDGVRVRLGPVTGIVHGAGVLADGLIAETSDAQFDAVFAAKGHGLRALLDATRDDPLTVLCVFSSIAGALGNPGQSGYAMANAALDHVAAAERELRPGCLVRSIAWGPWRGGMVDRTIAERFAAADVALLPLDAGAAALVAELDHQGPDTLVVVEAVPGFCSRAADEDAMHTDAAIHVRTRSHPYLADHRIGGHAVLPMAVALEWLLRAVGTAPRPGMTLKDARVLRKLELPGLANGGSRLRVTAEPAGAGHTARLCSADGTVHYQATVHPHGEPAQDWAPFEAQLASDAANGGSFAAGRRLHAGELRADAEASAVALRPSVALADGDQQHYDGRLLFHGPLFRVLRTVECVTRDGAAAVVVGLADLGWPQERWGLDSAAVDGAFQLAVLWADRVAGWPALPMAVREFRLHRPGPLPAAGRCVLRAGRVDEDGVQCDVAVLDADGQARVELLGVELVRRPEQAA